MIITPVRTMSITVWAYLKLGQSLQSWLGEHEDYRVLQEVDVTDAEREEELPKPEVGVG